MREIAILLLGVTVGLAVGLALGRVGALARRRRIEHTMPATPATPATPAGPAGPSAVDPAAAQRAAVEAMVRPIAATLDRVSDQLARAEVERAASHAELREQVRRTAEGAESLRAEAGRLVTALRRSEVRGRWGEVQLRRLVEAAGLLDHVHFTEQAHSPGDDGDGALRPDLLVHLADGRHVVVDAKVPLSAFLDAAACDGEDERRAALSRHAAEVLTHIDRLAAKEYWRRYDSPEFVVLFLPAESFLSSALEARPDLLERAFSRDVVLATPTTLLALLRTVAYAWRQDSVARNAAEVHALGRELHGRLATLGQHLARLGGALDSAVEQFNRTVGSLESRVLVSARRLATLGAVDAPDEEAGLPPVRLVTSGTRRPADPGTGRPVPGVDPEQADEQEADAMDPTAREAQARAFVEGRDPQTGVPGVPGLPDHGEIDDTSPAGSDNRPSVRAVPYR